MLEESKVCFWNPEGGLLDLSRFGRSTEAKISLSSLDNSPL